MKNFIIWGALVLIAYFGADIVEKGQALNSVTPWPGLGWLLWIALFFFVWHWLLRPVFSFIALKNAANCTDRVRVKAVLRYLKHLPKNDALRVQWIPKCQNALVGNNKQEQRDFLVRFSEEDTRTRAASEMITKYSLGAGVAVVFSRNNMVDGIIMLVTQGKLVVELARLAGYKPSPVFNALCFSWILANSVLNALFVQNATAVAGDMAATAIGEMLMSPEEIGADFAGTKFCSFTISTLLEALVAASTVYVTGHIFLRKLQLEHAPNEKGRLQELIALRRQARKELGREILKSTPKLLKAAANRVDKTIMSAWHAFWGNGDEAPDEDAPLDKAS